MLFEHVEIQQLLVSKMTVMILTINLLILSWHCDLMSGVRKLFQVGQLGQVCRLLRAHILKVFKRTNKVFYSNNSFYFRRPRRLNKTRQSSEFFFSIFHQTSSNGLVGWRDAQDDLGGQGGHGGGLCKSLNDKLVSWYEVIIHSTNYSFFWNPEYSFNKTFIFSCPGQLNKWHCR